MSAPTSEQRALRVARQHLETTRLMGVDFVPLGRPAPRPAPAKPAAPVAPPASRPVLAPDPGPADLRAKRQALLDDLLRRHDAECAHCTHATAHTRTVFGEGDPCARLMFVGEAPGAEEDRTGRPFVGRSGEKLDAMIQAIGLRREDVYIANILKARPPNNATPTPEEALRCGVWLHQQIAIIAPRVIVTLGKPAANYLLDNRDSMGSMRGRWFECAIPGIPHPIPVLPTFHPAYLLRAYTLENRKLVWSDLQKARDRLQNAEAH